MKDTEPMKTKLLVILAALSISLSALAYLTWPGGVEAQAPSVVPQLHCVTSVTANNRVAAGLCHENYHTDYLVWYRIEIQWCQPTWYGCRLRVSFGPWRVNGAVSVAQIPPRIRGYIFYVKMDW